MPIDSTYYVVEDMLKGVSLMELLKKYGRDFLYHYSSYLQFVGDLRKEKFDNITSGLKPIYDEALSFD